MPRPIEPTKAENKNVIQSVIDIFHLQLLIVISFRGILGLREIRSATFCFLPNFRHLAKFAMKGNEFFNADPHRNKRLVSESMF